MRFSETIANAEREIAERLNKFDQYSETEPEIVVKTTDELYEFGCRLLEESIQRTYGLDSKAQMLATLVGGVIAVLLSTSSQWLALLTNERAPLLSGLVFLLVAGALAVLAFSPRRYQWIDTDTWFAAEHFHYPDQLKRHYLLAIYRAVASSNQKSNQRGYILTASESCFMFGAFLLAIPLMVELWRLGGRW